MSNVSSHPIVVAPVDKPSSKTNVIYIRGLPDDVMEYIDQETELYGISRNVKAKEILVKYVRSLKTE